VRKLGVPGHDELAFRAIATGGTRVLNQQVESLRIPLEWIEAIDAKERRELELRGDRVYRGERAPPDLAGRAAIVVDDGLATGSTMPRPSAPSARTIRPGSSSPCRSPTPTSARP
jgi:predicted phosphoribosyltransferase